ncbi:MULTISPECIES: 2-oxoacid:acceptor oxidoreductase family protein [Caldisericum]|jgi:pyruvate ferredoxin oxidoreductase gamma subunit|uniref:2-oxoacid:acceptor oxidoreductase family protein n=1 Tax=Caldisericum TaxID=693074 RepID=UPI0039FCD206
MAVQTKKSVYEVRFHGRAGQGAKSGSQMLALAAFKEGKSIQAFPEYGSERRGAPTVAYTRISDKEIRTHEPIVNPDAVLVFDFGLAKNIPVTSGLDEETGVLIVNTTKTPEEIRQITGFKGKIYTVDATGISLELLKIDAPNVPMLGTLVKATGIVKLETLEEVIREEFLDKIGEEKVQKNIQGLKRGFEEAKNG